MPIYEYQCQSCGQRMEIMQKMSDPAPSECPACHATELKKLMSAGSIRSKGPGIDNAPACASGGCGAACMSGD